MRRRRESWHRSEWPLDNCIVLAGDLILERDRHRLVLVLDVRAHVVQIVHGVVTVAAEQIVVLVEVNDNLRVGVHGENGGRTQHLLLLLLG